MDSLLEKLKEMGAKVDDTLGRLRGDEEFYIAQLKRLPDNKNMIGLRQAVDAKDATEAEHQVHTLKGTALTLGLLSLSDETTEMLLDFRDGYAEDAFARIDKVESEFQKWADAVKES